MKLLKEYELQFDHPQWAYDPELALVDTVLNRHPELYALVSADLLALGKNNQLGRQDGPAIEQVVRAALFKELKGLDYQKLEYAQVDSRICPLFLKLGNREPFSYEVLHKYISAISAESLQKLLVRVNQLAIEENLEDPSQVREDSTVVETDIHYPTNNSLLWDSIRTCQRLLGQLKQLDPEVEADSSVRAAKKDYFKINLSSSPQERQQLFAQQLERLKRSIKQTAKALKQVQGKGQKGSRKSQKLCQKLEQLLPKLGKIYVMVYQKEGCGEPVDNADKLYSLFEDHTNIIVKGGRQPQFGHKVDLAIGARGLILVCQVAEGNPSDRQFFPEALKQLKDHYRCVPKQMATDGGYACLDNLNLAKREGVLTLVFNKVRGSLQNLVGSARLERRLKKWRSGIEAVISNWKRGFGMFRCTWKGRRRFEAKVLWSVLAYNFRAMTRVALAQLAA